MKIMLTNLIKAAVSVAVTPAAVIADVLTLPASAHDGKATFGRTAQLLNNAGANVQSAIEPSRRSEQ